MKTKRGNKMKKVIQIDAINEDGFIQLEVWQGGIQLRKLFSYENDRGFFEYEEHESFFVAKESVNDFLKAIKETQPKKTKTKRK